MYGVPSKTCWAPVSRDNLSRDDLSRDLELCVTIADLTGCDTISFTEHGRGRVWRYRGPDGEGDGLDISYGLIVWTHKGAFLRLRGKLDLPGVGEDTIPSEATIAIRLPVETPGPTPEVCAELLVPFEVRKRLWYYVRECP